VYITGRMTRFGNFKYRRVTPHLYFDRVFCSTDPRLLKRKDVRIKEYIAYAADAVKLKKDFKRKPSIYDVPLVFEFDMDNQKSMSIYDFLYDWFIIILPIIILTIVPWA
jgi:hypothetical protein